MHRGKITMVVIMIQVLEVIGVLTGIYGLYKMGQALLH